MKIATSLSCRLALIIATLGLAVRSAEAQVSVGVDPSSNWLGFMNVSNLPAPDGDGAYQFGSSWGTADLVAIFDGPTLQLTPNTINDPDPYWYIGGGGPGAPGNKIMEANFYVEDTGTFNGQTVTFSGEVLSNTLDPSYTTVAFIRDFAPDYSSSVGITIPLAPGAFSLSLATINDPARHVQYGFQTVGRNVWFTDVAQFGEVRIAAVPEPAGLGMAALGMALLAGRCRRR